MLVSENLSEKALREIYLRAFRIAVEEGEPWTVMSSYNKINGFHVCNMGSLLTGVLRDEWGFNGLVMSDWNAVEQCSYALAINAGNDLIMPGTDHNRKELMKMLSDGRLHRDALNTSAARVLTLVFKSETAKGF
jgi:beta-glucosidase